MLRNRLVFSLMIAGCVSVPATRAGVIVNTSLTLNQFSATSDDPNGVFQIVSPLIATADAEVQDTLNGDSGDSNRQVGDGSASASASTGLVSANSAASS